jgi:hypothetical protein
MKRFGCLTAAALLLACSISGRAAADETDVAEELFREGHALLKEQRYSEACPKFAESEQHDAASGTLLALAYCQELGHLLASAQTSYIAAAELARAEKQEDRQRAATERAEALTTRLSTLTVEVPAALWELPGLRVTNNGVELPRAVWGRPVPADGGTLMVQVSAANRAPWSSQILLGVERDQRVVVVPVLAPIDVAAPVQLPPPGPRAAALPQQPAPLAEHRYWTVPHAVGWAAIGAGAASGVTALYFVFVAKSAQTDVENALRADATQSGPASSRVTWDSSGHGRELDGQHAQALAQGFGIASGALLLGGAALVIFGKNETEHGNPSVSLGVGPGVTRLNCTGAF